MNHVPIVKRRRGPITTAVGELEDRVRSMELVVGPGLRVSTSGVGTVVTLSANTQPTGRRARSNRAVWG